MGSCGRFRVVTFPSPDLEKSMKEDTHKAGRLVCASRRNLSLPNDYGFLLLVCVRGFFLLGSIFCFACLVVCLWGSCVGVGAGGTKGRDPLKSTRRMCTKYNVLFTLRLLAPPVPPPSDAPTGSCFVLIKGTAAVEQATVALTLHLTLTRQASMALTAQPTRREGRKPRPTS